MIVAGQRLPIVVATRPVDFRCGHQALALIVQDQLKLDPHSGVTVIFRSKRGDRLKILVWDGSGLVLIHKRLEQGNFAWPKVQDGVMRRSRAQYEALFDGLEWRRVVAQRVAPPAAAGRLRRPFPTLFCWPHSPDRVGRRMSQLLDLSQFPDLPPEVVKAFEAAEFELSVERAARLHEQAVVAEKDAFIAELKELIGKLEGQVAQYRQAKFGPKSEKLDPAQLELAFEDLETAIAETEARIAAVEERIAASAPDAEKKPRKARSLPDHLPRVERVIEPERIACPCGCGDMVRIGEDRTERLDIIPARYQVIVTIRPKCACPKGRTGAVQARASAHLLEGSWPTEALLAHIALAKHSEHMPLTGRPWSWRGSACRSTARCWPTGWGAPVR
ncbi:hypothetical protein CESP606_15725 [Cereibacter sphaeroides]|jgi:Transposase and inactivated derivatives|nr:hypothetical protein APX01_15380 [Cereibacter sphaeroides]ANS35673.1 hypothetical protein A3858_15400 [Cereibacter sphaeroides]ATN64726.1 hypothetical protein A3857_15395 [Cereibacter sphaeroides]GEM93963.1 hypothetical protein RSP03_30300 [Cereibacter sphaeroides]